MPCIDELIDRVARAIWETNHPNPPGWAAWGDYSGWGPSPPEREFTIKQAKAAIEAMGFADGTVRQVSL
jgi:hypothetical protein